MSGVLSKSATTELISFIRTFHDGVLISIPWTGLEVWNGPLATRNARIKAGRIVLRVMHCVTESTGGYIPTVPNQRHRVVLNEGR